MQKGEGGMKGEGGDVSEAFARWLEGLRSSIWEGQCPVSPPCLHSSAALLPAEGWVKSSDFI